MITAPSADVYKGGKLAARLERYDNGVNFYYLAAYLDSGGPSIASTLPLNGDPVRSQAGAIPAFFAGLLPEGRRLTALRRAIKTSADDELSLLLAVGEDTIGDVQVLPLGAEPRTTTDALVVDKPFEEMSFREVIGESGIGPLPALAGVQEKTSAAMISVPLAQRNARYILKLSPPENPYLVENEAFFLELARRNRMPVAASRIVRDRDKIPGLLVTRFDRIWDGQRIRMLAVEDACQAMGLWPADKYNVSTEDVAEALMNLTPARAVAAQEILRQLTFAWLTGNGDLHAKNIAVMNSPEVGKRMTPAYDLPSTLFYDDTVLALTVGGRDTLSAGRITAFAGELGLPSKAAARTMRQVLTATAPLPELVKNLPFDRRVLDKASRQLATRHREIERAVAN